MSSTKSRMTWQFWQNVMSFACSRPTAVPSSIMGSGMMQMPMNSSHCDAAVAISRRLKRMTYAMRTMATTTPSRLMGLAHSSA